MKKRFFSMLIIMASVLLIGSNAAWAGISSDYPNGETVGVFSGNDNDFESIVGAINNYFIELGYDVDLVYYAKVDSPDTIYKDDGVYLELTYDVVDNGDRIAGNWVSDEAPDSEPYTPINFYSLKAGNRYAIYWVNPENTFGTWNTVYDLNSKNLSHFTAWVWKNPPPPDQPVPEPATLFLMGMGLIGITRFWKKKK